MTRAGWLMLGLAAGALLALLLEAIGSVTGT